MAIDRRLFMAGVTIAAMPSGSHAHVTAGKATPAQRSALDAIENYLEAHRSFFALPAMGMVVTDADFTAYIQSGTRDYAGKLPLDATELWQIGSISKSITALIALQLAEEGKIDLEADIRSVLPEAPLPAGAPFTVKSLLDHTSGLPDFAPAWPACEPLWRGFEPDTHYSYSNTAYELIGAMIARIDGRPLAQSIAARVLTPLGMARSRGAIVSADRAHYTASFMPLQADLPIRQQNALAPASWVDVTSGAGSVSASLGDMARYLRFMVGIGRGSGGGLISDATAARWLEGTVIQSAGTPDETYGRGLMHRIDDGRQLLHHTGGMPSFSSSFHVDAAAGVGAFASCAIGNTGYRPRLLTRYAVKALRLAAAGKPIPPPPPLSAIAMGMRGDYVGIYGKGAITVAGPKLSIENHALEAIGPDRFVTDHPSYARFPLTFVRVANAVVAIDYGPHRFVRQGMTAELPATPPRLAARAGRYDSDNAWLGTVTIVARGDKLLMGGNKALIGNMDAIVEVGDDVWQAESPAWLPERVRFARFVGGQPQIAVISGRIYERRDV